MLRLNDVGAEGPRHSREPSGADYPSAALGRGPWRKDIGW